MVEALKPMDQHRSIGFLQDVTPNFNHEVRPDTDEIPVERSVMQTAQGSTIADCGHAQRISVGHDVRGFQKLVTLQPADCAVVLVRSNDAFAKLSLMKALTKDARCVTSPESEG